MSEQVKRPHDPFKHERLKALWAEGASLAQMAIECELEEGTVAKYACRHRKDFPPRQFHAKRIDHYGFGEILLDLRQRAGLTQADAAKVLDVGLRTYATWERGDDPKRKPHVLTQEGALARLRKLKTPRNAAP